MLTQKLMRCSHEVFAMSVNHSLGVLFMTFYDVILTKLNNSKINQKQFVFVRREWEQLQQTSV